MKKLGSGGGSNKLVAPGVKTGSPSRKSSPGAADQLGQSTAFKKEVVNSGPGYNAAKFGNEAALNVGKGGPGAGRTIMRSGSQGTHGAVAGAPRPPGRDILSQFGPEKSKG